jgi:hypothetical protein
MRVFTDHALLFELSLLDLTLLTELCLSANGFFSSHMLLTLALARTPRPT